MSEKNFRTLQSGVNYLFINKLHPKVSVKFQNLKLSNFRIKKVIKFVEGFAVSCPVKGYLRPFPLFFKTQEKKRKIWNYQNMLMIY